MRTYNLNLLATIPPVNSLPHLPPSPEAESAQGPPTERHRTP